MLCSAASGRSVGGICGVAGSPFHRWTLDTRDDQVGWCYPPSQHAHVSLFLFCSTYKVPLLSSESAWYVDGTSDVNNVTKCHVCKASLGARSHHSP